MSMIRYAMSLAILLTGFSAQALAENPSPKMLSCAQSQDRPYCEKQKTNLAAAWPKANAGDYMSQRGVAFCLLSGCSGAVEIDLKAACVWQIVILGTEKSDSSDTANFRQACRRLDAADLSDAEAQARISYGRIFKRLLTIKLPLIPA
jgi:hypothetical protein